VFAAASFLSVCYLLRPIIFRQVIRNGLRVRLIAAGAVYTDVLLHYTSVRGQLDPTEKLM
jgi:hypothetical protein